MSAQFVRYGPIIIVLCTCYVVGKEVGNSDPSLAFISSELDVVPCPVDLQNCRCYFLLKEKFFFAGPMDCRRWMVEGLG